MHDDALTELRQDWVAIQVEICALIERERRRKRAGFFLILITFIFFHKASFTYMYILLG